LLSNRLADHKSAVLLARQVVGNGHTSYSWGHPISTVPDLYAEIAMNAITELQR